MKGGTFRQWRSYCQSCKLDCHIWGWNYQFPLECPDCGNDTELLEDGKKGEAPGVIGDELHDYSARHAVCNDDGTPRKFYSKTDLKRALNEKGFTIMGDTPKPYKV